MSVESEKDIKGLKKIGRIIALALREMKTQVRPGMTTAELDGIGKTILDSHDARSAPNLVYGFPGTTCISINDEAAHGIPNDRVIREGDLVNIDISAELDGYFADAAVTVPVPPITSLKWRLCHCTQEALKNGMAAARAGNLINAIGRAVESTAEQCGFSIIQDLPGHGVGRNIHEEPTIPGFYAPWMNQRLTEGMVITVEPFLSTGARQVTTDKDGWTLKTPDGSLSVQYEHTIVVTCEQPMIITAM